MTAPTLPPAQASHVAALHAALTQLDGVILGKGPQIRLAVACLLARGHLLIEDQPGVGKTTLAQALARTCGLHFRRVQFTADLLPADLTGVSVWDASSSAFRFVEGRCSASCSSRTRSTVPRPARRAPCWNPWRNGRSRRAA